MLIADATRKQLAITGTQARMSRASATLALCMALAAVTVGAASADAPPTSTAKIVVTFPITAPDSTEQDVAARYRLEPIERRDSPALARRIVVYRIPDGRAQADVLNQIGADARVSSAQPNFAYTAPLDQAPDPVVASRPREETPPGRTRRRGTASAGKPEADRRRADRAPSTTLPREDAASPSPRSRISSLGGDLAWPTADEPFVGPLRGGR